MYSALFLSFFLMNFRYFNKHISNGKEGKILKMIEK